jgi:peptide/nickel transport system permease protein
MRACGVLQREAGARSAEPFAMTATTTLVKPTAREWLLAQDPASRFQAMCGSFYRAGLEILANKLAFLGLVIVIALFLVAILAPLIAHGISPLAQDLAGRLQPPGAGHWFGTDELGRDIFARTVYGSRATLAIIALVGVIVAPIGLAVGTTAGYLGGAVDIALMRITDIFLAFPRLVLAIAFAAALGPGIENAVIAISLTAWPPYARLARAETIAVAKSDYIAAVVLHGASTLRILMRHVVPLCISSVIVRLTLDMAGIIITAAGLGFLGLGAQPPTPEWGAMVSAGRAVILDQWWVATIPGFAIFVVSLGFNLLGDGLRDIFDPKSR